MSVLLGVRIEFYRSSGDQEPAAEAFLGAAVREAGFAATAVPAAGDRLSLTTLTGGTDLPLHALDGGAFVPVVKVEHQPVAVEHGDPDQQASWWAAAVTVPTATVVVHAAGPAGGDETRALVDGLAGMGWTVMPGSEQLASH